MSLDTYTNLKSEIAGTLDRDDLTSEIDTFIDLAEQRHKDEVRIREMLRRAQTPLDDVTPSRYLALPPSFAQMMTLRLLTDPLTILQEVDLDAINRVRRETKRRPSYFTVHEEIEFDTLPDDDYTAEMIYWAAFTPLSDANQTNGLLTRAPALYLYGALLAAEPYLVNDERIPTWANFYNTHKESLLMSDRKSRHGGSIVSKVVGATP